MNFPFVSVILAVKNGEQYIEDALTSVFEQEYEPLEIIVIDDGSTDQTTEIIKKFGRKIKLIKQASSGVSAARNRGIREAKGDLIAFQSHDDLWTANKLKTQINFMLKNPDILFTVGKVEHFLDEEGVIPAGFRPELLEGHHTAYIPETLVAKREVFDLVGFFDESFPIGEDVDWFARAKDLNIASAVVPQVLLNKRIHGANSHLTTNVNNQNLLRAIRNSIARKRKTK